MFLIQKPVKWFNEYSYSQNNNWWSWEKALDVNKLIQKADNDTERTEIEGKYFTTNHYDRLISDIFVSKIKQKKWLMNLIFLVS